MSSIVGPPYAISTVTPPLGPVTGNQTVKIHGTGFSSTSGMVNVSFTAGKHSATAQGSVIDDDTIECKTPDVVATIGPKRCEVRLAIGVRDFTTTKTVYDYYLNTQPDKSMCYGPGLLEEGQADVKTSFVIQARNMNAENRKSGADDYVITIIQDKQDADVRTMSRTGEPYELLLGPLFFTIVMDVVGIYFFRTQVGALMMAALGVGDGVAPIAGARGTHKYTLLGRPKTLEGSAACLVGCMIGSIVFLSLLGMPPIDLVDNAKLALLATVVEAVSPPDVDNFLMPLAVWWAYPHVIG